MNEGTPSNNFSLPVRGTRGNYCSGLGSSLPGVVNAGLAFTLASFQVPSRRTFCFIHKMDSSAEINMSNGLFYLRIAYHEIKFLDENMEGTFCKLTSCLSLSRFNDILQWICIFIALECACDCRRGLFIRFSLI